MEITFVRHAQPDWEPDERAVDEPTLTRLGHDQALLTAEAIARERKPFDAIYVSPQPRAQQTAAPIAEKLGIEVQPLSWLRELELPSLAGRTPEQVQEFFRSERMRDPERLWEGFSGGESFRHFYERVSSGLESLLLGDHRLRVHENDGHRMWDVPDPLWDARLLVVAHEGTNSVAISHLLGIEPNPWAPLRFSIAWTGMTRLHTTRLGGGAVWSLEYFNRTDHLSELEDEPDGRSARFPLGTQATRTDEP